MVFSSIAFLYYFLPVILIIYFISPNKIRNLILLLFSLIFYAYGEPIYVLIMFISILSSYINGLLIEKYFEQNFKKIFLGIDLTISLGLLGLFKYTDFFIANINYITGMTISSLHLLLPIGISFYTFQTISYTIDVYNGKIKAQKNIITLGTYVVMFPQLIAGPIVRYIDIEESLKKRKHSFENFAEGMRRFIIGLAKKVILANNFALIYDIFLNVNDKTLTFYWLANLAFMFQIYFDFSGYSDMAIGLGRIFGFKFLENFNYPYVAKSITDFWRRWHISLSTWFKDYVYISLGGSKVGKFKTLRNIIIVWLLTGLWHGPAWNFIFWGIYFSIILILEKLWLGKILEKLPRIISHFYTKFIIYISWIIFNNASPLTELTKMFGITKLPFSNEVTTYYFKSYFILIAIGIIGCTPLMKNIILKLKETKYQKIINLIEPIILIILLVLTTAYLIDDSFNPFIYFRF